MDGIGLPDTLRDQARTAWLRYLEHVAGLRPALHRTCRRLTGDPWDAEDLLQETLLRGFATLGSTHHTVRNPRGYLVRIATNLWIDAVRRRRREDDALEAGVEGPADPAASPAQGVALREAGAALMQRLPPKERAALVLKDVFDMDADAIAELLGSTQGAVKAALRRARGRLRDPDEEGPARRAAPSAALVDRFVERLEASDLPGLLALMLDTATVEMPGVLVEHGRAEFERTGSWLWQAVHVHPERPPETRPEKFHNERGVFRGEAVMLSFAPRGDPRPLMAVTRFEELDGRIARIRAYNFCPETVAEVGAALGLVVGDVPSHLLAALQPRERATRA